MPRAPHRSVRSRGALVHRGPIARPARRSPRALGARCVTLALAALVAACEHPIAVLTPHVEIADLVVRDGAGGVVARTVENRRWEGATLVATDGASVRLVFNPLDFRDAEFSIADRPDLEVRVEAEDEALVRWEPQRDHGLLLGVAAGATRVRFLVWHQSHADFVSPWLPIEVRAARPAGRRAATVRQPEDR